MSSLSKRYRSRGALRLPDAGELMPPNLSTFDAVPFGATQRTHLRAWLSQGAWPREHMELEELEGYLVALITWPVVISSGAWLPRIWGERGWKVPTRLAARAKYEEFVALIAGFLQDLDRQLSYLPPKFATALSALREPGRADALHLWGRGFMTALAFDSQGLEWRTPGAQAAVQIIASRTSSPVVLRAQAIEDVENAVLTLLAERTSRGPLGRLGS